MALNTEQLASESKGKRGGARKGAGRPKRDLARWMDARGIGKATAAEILDRVDERQAWYRVLHSEDDSVVLRALMYLTSMRDGKPAQQINVTSTTLNLSTDDIAKARAIVQRLGLSSSAIDADSLLTSKQSARTIDATISGSIMVSEPEGVKKDGDG